MNLVVREAFIPKNNKMFLAGRVYIFFVAKQ